MVNVARRMIIIKERVKKKKRKKIVMQTQCLTLPRGAKRNWPCNTLAQFLSY